MNTQLLKARMEAFFAQVSPEYLVAEFEKMGYCFIDSEVEWKSPAHYAAISMSAKQPDIGFVKRIFAPRKQNPIKNLTSEFSGSFFCLKLHNEREYS